VSIPEELPTQVWVTWVPGKPQHTTISTTLVAAVAEHQRYLNTGLGVHTAVVGMADAFRNMGVELEYVPEHHVPAGFIPKGAAPGSVDT
jgi:hypothetical protein